MSELSRNTNEMALCFGKSILALYNAQTIKDFPVMVWLYDLFQNCYSILPALFTINTGLSSSFPLPTTHMCSRSKFFLKKKTSDGKSLKFSEVVVPLLAVSCPEKGQ